MFIATGMDQSIDRDICQNKGAFGLRDSRGAISVAGTLRLRRRRRGGAAADDDKRGGGKQATRRDKHPFYLCSQPASQPPRPRDGRRPTPCVAGTVCVLCSCGTNDFGLMRPTATVRVRLSVGLILLRPLRVSDWIPGASTASSPGSLGSPAPSCIAFGDLALPTSSS